MNTSHLKRVGLKLALLTALSLSSVGVAEAQTYYTPSGFGDLVAGFRKTGAFAENSELVVNLGNVTNFLKLSVGTTINISNYSRLQLTNMAPDNLANLQWSAFSSVQAHGFPDAPWITPLGSFPAATCWYTLLRADFNTQSTPLPRASYNTQGNLRSQILGVGNGARSISQTLGVTNQFNNTLLVVEPVVYFSDGTLSSYIGDLDDVTFGDFRGQKATAPLGDNSVENITPDPFDSAQRCDFYESCPAGLNLVDPLSGKTNGPAYYVGYFTLNPDGNMTFTRATSSTSGGGNPPPPTVLTINTSLLGAASPGQVGSIISFSTTNGATYSLRYTNAAGLTTPIATWPVATGTITGDGQIHSFTNSSPDQSRFYRVVGQ
jgi:hypothetical protein